MSLVTGPLGALGASFVFVFAVIGLAAGLLRTGAVDAFTSRKLIHIGVAHWWFFYQFWIADPAWGLVGPVFFVAFNLAARRMGFLRAMEPGTGESNLGTIYFPLSLILAVAWSGWGGLPPWVAGAGILVLGWADGLAALTGRALGRHRLPVSWSDKTWEGTAALAAAGFLVLMAFFLAFAAPASGVTGAWLLTQAAKALGIALVLALTEALIPFGLDNLLLPAVASGLVWVLL